MPIDYIVYQVIAYIKFLLKSTNQHGVHSPFVFDFVTKCLYDKTEHNAYKKIENYRNSIIKSKTIIEVSDLGAGSKKLDKTQRNISKMAKTSSSTKKNSNILYRVSKYFKFKNSLELGTSLGLGTYALALADPTSNIITIEGCPNTSDFAKSKFKYLNIENTTFKTGDFTTVIPTLQTKTFDFIFFDGHHNKNATISYFESLLTKINNETVFVFDDIYWSKGMTDAWEYIKTHPSVTVTVDCFYLGFVFFRKEQAKEHFKIRV